LRLGSKGRLGSAAECLHRANTYRSTEGLRKLRVKTLKRLVADRGKWDIGKTIVKRVL